VLNEVAPQPAHAVAVPVAAGTAVGGWGPALAPASGADPPAARLSSARHASQKLSPGHTGWPQAGQGLGEPGAGSPVMTTFWAAVDWQGRPVAPGA
jgi:hypothetical protein